MFLVRGDPMQYNAMQHRQAGSRSSGGGSSSGSSRVPVAVSLSAWLAGSRLRRRLRLRELLQPCLHTVAAAFVDTTNVLEARQLFAFVCWRLCELACVHVYVSVRVRARTGVCACAYKQQWGSPASCGSTAASTGWVLGSPQTLAVAAAPDDDALLWVSVDG
eukprot:GHVU01155586.1.p2 GENE.GHVU01155586.1~~GHVU01155586.1.p2  ORF type:complete len:162 (-),score=19.55 GHVU01155586.1:170-655(-)